MLMIIWLLFGGAKDTDLQEAGVSKNKLTEEQKWQLFFKERSGPDGKDD